MDLDYLHGRNLDKTTYHQRIEMLTGYFLLFAERYGMLPPMSDETMNSNPFHVTDAILESVAHDFKWEEE
jgi:hypothetical protein